MNEKLLNELASESDDLILISEKISYLTNHIIELSYPDVENQTDKEKELLEKLSNIQTVADMLRDYSNQLKEWELINRLKIETELKKSM